MNIPATPFIRQAHEKDAKTLAQLINIAGEGIPNWLWTRQCVEGQTPLEIGTERARRATGGFSYTNALLAEKDARPLGMVLSYAITKATQEDPDKLPAPIAPFVELEKLSVDTWYINALAVFAQHRGQDIGTRLMNSAEDLAASNGYRTMSIQVYAQNRGAVRLYERLGYDGAAKAPVRLHPSPPYYTGDVLLLTKALSR
ncbi:MAG: GNAT family N-acetyltransferase [Pseudomonadota bacterium]